MVSRRQFLITGAAGAVLPATSTWMQPAIAAIAGGSLDPEAISKYRMPLVIPPAMPAVDRGSFENRNGRSDPEPSASREFASSILDLERQMEPGRRRDSAGWWGRGFAPSASRLGRRGVEGGGNLLGQAFASRHVDECFWYLAPRICGGGVMSVGGVAFPPDGRSVELAEVWHGSLGDNFLIHGYPVWE